MTYEVARRPGSQVITSPPNSRRPWKSRSITSEPGGTAPAGGGVTVVDATLSGALRQPDDISASIILLGSYPETCDDAATSGAALNRVSGPSGVTARSSSQMLPFPPEPAVIAISIAANDFSLRSLVGPQANEIWRFLRLTVVQSFGNRKF